MKKTLLIILSIALMFSTLCLCASASESDATSSSAGTNFFADIYKQFLDNSDKIFSLLSFASSLLIILCYKRGILPILKGGIGAVKSGVGKINEQSEKQNAHSEAISGLLSGKLASFEGALERIDENFASLYAQLKTAENSSAGMEKIFTILSAETELLYEIFISSSLPTYEKERIGEKIAAIRARLSGDTRAEGGCNEA